MKENNALTTIRNGTLRYTVFCTYCFN